MHCDNCAQRIEGRVGALAGVTHIQADHQRDLVVVEHTNEVTDGQVRAALHQLGFDVTDHDHAARKTST